jgi:uncharacterized membrane protein YtjA (UPF0391 family)
MLIYALAFLLVAVVASVLGFVTVAGAATWGAQLLFGWFLVLLVVSLLGGRRPPVQCGVARVRLELRRLRQR